MKTEEVIFKASVSEPLKSLIQGCLARNPCERLTIEEIVEL